jgi:hypothetical protein
MIGRTLGPQVGVTQDRLFVLSTAVKGNVWSIEREK